MFGNMNFKDRQSVVSAHAADRESGDYSPVVPLIGHGWWRNLLSKQEFSTLSFVPERLFREPSVSVRFAGQHTHFVSDPHMVRTVLRQGSEVMRKPKLLHRILSPVMGEGIMLTEGMVWREQRRDLAVAFTQRKLDSYVPLIEMTADSVCREMAAATCPEGMDILTRTTWATFRVICDIFMGEGIGPDQRVVDDAFRRLISPGSLARRLLPFAQSKWLLGKTSEPEVDRLMAILRNARDKSPAFTSKKAQRGLSDAPELADGANLSDTEALTHNLLTMLVAGFDTTAVTLAWTLYLLSFDEDLQEKLFAEAHAPLSVGHDGGARGILRAHPLMLSVIREAMRLYPPVALIGRTAVQPLTMGDLQIKPGSLVLLSMYSMHRHEAHWKDPDRFDPYRFMDPDAESQAAYMPFGFGPRICIGQHLAELELVTMLSRMMRTFRLKRVTARPPKPIMTLTLRPEGGLWLIPIPR